MRAKKTKTKVSSFTPNVSAQTSVKRDLGLIDDLEDLTIDRTIER